MFLGKRVLVLGLGLSGRSAAEFLIAHSAEVHAVDRDDTLFKTHPEVQMLKQKGMSCSLEKDCPPVESFDFLILSPGIPAGHSLVQRAKQGQIPVYGEIELGSRVVKNPIIAITGTNGKTTVTLMVTHILQHCGIAAKALGNVGAPFTRDLLQIDDRSVIVLELSSYQLETLSFPFIDGGVILNITPDHLDRYPSMEAYAQAKCHMEQAMKQGKKLYMEEGAWNAFGYLFHDIQPLLYGYREECFVFSDLESVFRNGEKAFQLPESLKHRRSHDLENWMAAYALCADRGIEGEQFLEAAQSFQKPAHRIEFVAEVHGVRYIDDSKGTNIDAVIRAVQSLEGPIILIAGGVDKGSSYTPWLKEFKNNVKLICVIGQAAAKINAQLSEYLPVKAFDTLDAAVRHAASVALNGDCVLLSPGCSSFDMFKDYAHRGCEFQRIVREMEEEVK